MNTNARDYILDKLRAAPRRNVPARPELPPPPEPPPDRSAHVASFKKNLEEVGGRLYQVGDRESFYRTLEEIFRENEVRRAMATTDAVLAPLDLPDWGRRVGMEVRTPRDFRDPAAFKDAVFLEVDAGVTGADFGIASSGTLVLAHDREQTRLVSLAPVLHVAVLPAERLTDDHDLIVDRLYGSGGRPSQVCLITGPSSTADIQATPFTGMHGPRRLVVILLV
ncbi:MAG: lactate utilization protein [bacterium]